MTNKKREKSLMLGRKVGLIALSVVVYIASPWSVVTRTNGSAMSIEQVEGLPLPSVLTAEEEALIQEQLVYTVGYSNATIPISYNLKGQLTGVSIEMMRDFSEMASVVFEFVDMDDVKNKERHIDMNLKMDNFSALSISDPFMVVPAIMVLRSDFSGDVEQVGILESLGLIDPFVSLEGKEVLEYVKFSEMDLALQRGEVDAIVLSTLRYPYIASEVGEYEYQVVLLEDVLEYNLYFSEGFPEEKIAVFNKLIQGYGDMRMDYLIAKHSNYATATMSTVEMIYENFNLIFASFLVATGMISGIMVLYQIRQKRKLITQMNYDQLTGLYTERKFVQVIEETVRANTGDTFTLLTFDIDNFKYINEMYGYEKGTLILQELGRMVGDGFSKGTPVARSYGDTFFALLTGEQVKTLTQQRGRDFVFVAEKMREILGKDYTFHFSLGLYTIKDALEEVSLMMDSATFARDKGKNVAGLTIYHYDEAMMRERSTNNVVSVTMGEALKHQEFVLYYQEKIDLMTQEISGVEALVRWLRGDTLVLPSEFIPIFEKNGFIEQLDYYVLEKACRFIKGAEVALPVVSVNFSGVTMMQDDLVERIMDILKQAGVKPEQVDIEVTESAFVDGVQKLIEKLEQLRILGFTISMDDFGAGLSSLHRLKGIPLDTLKIDREFIVDSLTNEKGRAIIKSVVQMGKDIQLNIVAEGIETQEQLELLRELGCQQGQGYIFSRPQPEREFLEVLESRYENS